ncbi:hypothetical protein [Roseateles sp.]|uniref:hypothetical protein n=1 Tax=Roseateles sp. TaxID=1971397 RepID=UPI0031E04FC6
MTLDRDPLHPAARQFVLKLDRRAEPGRGEISGRLENLASGRACEFRDMASLLQALARELADQQKSPPA